VGTTTKIKSTKKSQTIGIQIVDEQRTAERRPIRIERVGYE
jgi:hypothetical protein